MAPRTVEREVGLFRQLGRSSELPGHGGQAMGTGWNIGALRLADRSPPPVRSRVGRRGDQPVADGADGAGVFEVRDLMHVDMFRVSTGD